MVEYELFGFFIALQEIFLDSGELSGLNKKPLIDDVFFLLVLPGSDFVINELLSNNGVLLLSLELEMIESFPEAELDLIEVELGYFDFL
jgi:hypothetical protein